MSKNLVLGTMDDNFINTLSTYSENMITVARLRKIAKEEEQKVENEKQALLDERQEKIDKGIAFVESDYSVVKYDNKIRAIKDKLTKDCEPYNKARREIIKNLDMKELYSAYVVGVDNANYSAVGTTVRVGKKKNVSYTNKKSFNNLCGKWLLEIGVKNADNEKTVATFVKKMIIPFIGTKLDKNTSDKVAFSNGQFADNFIISIVKALVKVNFLVKDENGTLSRKNQK